MFSRLPPVLADAGDASGGPDGGPSIVHEPGPAQPCPAHRYACTVYKERPGACHAYECALLRRLNAGEVTHDEALNLIDRARTLRDRARAGMEGVLGVHAGLGLNDLAGEFSALVHHVRDALHMYPHHADAQEHLSALDQILARHFHIAAEDSPPGATERAPA